MPTNLTEASATVGAISQLVYTVPVNTKSVAICTIFSPLGNDQVVVNLYKEKTNGDTIRLIPLNTNVYPNIDTYRVPIDKLILLAGEKVYASAGSPTPTARATGLFGLPTILDIEVGDAIADFSMSLAERT